MIAASHTAALAFRYPELETAALPILIAALQSGGSNSIEYTPLKQVAQHYVRQGQVDQLKPVLEKVLASRQTYYTRLSGNDDYVIHLQRREFAAAAVEVAGAHDLNLTLEFFGRLSDMPASPRNYGTNPSDSL
ncbi:MAG TPA: hypothetical protein VM915_00045, partial [Verrucomicrobiae bacterium]|nr:hypothetical protein [Verrucomicrobiae bacterium]